MATITKAEEVFQVESLAELQAAAQAVLPFLAQNPTVLFEGDMGAGKTTFIKALCREMGVTDSVSSPTFSLVNEYETREGKRIYHFDFYRINSEDEALNIGFYDYLDSGNTCLIEWPTKVQNLLPDHYSHLTITSRGGEKRTITLKQI